MLKYLFISNLVIFYKIRHIYLCNEGITCVKGNFTQKFLNQMPLTILWFDRETTQPGLVAKIRVHYLLRYEEETGTPNGYVYFDGC